MTDVAQSTSLSEVAAKSKVWGSWLTAGSRMMMMTDEDPRRGRLVRLARVRLSSVLIWHALLEDLDVCS